MKALLFTVHRTLNYGSVLQTYACSRIFSRMGWEMTVADFTRPTDYNMNAIRSLMHYICFRDRLKEPRGFSAKLKGLAASCVTYPLTKRFWQNCESFLREHVNLSAPIENMAELTELAKEYDLLCSGSDQIWNTEYNKGTDQVYLLGFSPAETKRIALSSSIGMDSLSETDQALFREYLPSFHAISVREEQAVTLLQEIGIQATHLLDPTLWITGDEWRTEAAQPPESEPYVLLYKLKADNRIDQIAQSVAQKLGIRVVRVCFSSRMGVKNASEQDVLLPALPEFLSLIANARFVVTNSFHGTCFSLNFNRDFISVPREHYNSRIQSVLNTTSLQERFVYSVDELDNTKLQPINYECVNAILNERRQQAFEWLKSALNNTTAKE